MENACDLAARFLAAGVEVVLADVADGSTLPVYRRRLPCLMVVRLQIELDEAERRAGLRPAHLSRGELLALHARQEAVERPVDRTLDVTRLSRPDQVAAVRALWV